MPQQCTAMYERLRSCDICPRRCRVDRLAGEVGYCGVGAQSLVASLGPHYGEEQPLVGSGGSGTVFMAGCNLGCIFCQNADISHGRFGRTMTADALAAQMLGLQQQGCHNINVVTPTHQTPAIIEALALARADGLTVPFVYNCSGYEALDVLEALDGIVDIYMPDVKYGSNEFGARYSDVPDYWDVCRPALVEMHRQVGDLALDDHGVATKGLLVRHLVLPGDTGATSAVLEFIASLSTNTYVNVMGQYRPCHRAGECPAIARPLRAAEWAAALQLARELKLVRGLAES